MLQLTEAGEQAFAVRCHWFCSLLVVLLVVVRTYPAVAYVDRLEQRPLAHEAAKDKRSL